jgi:hypothetical protein
MLLSKDMGWGRPPLWPLLEGVGGAQLIPRKSDLLLTADLSLWLVDIVELFVARVRIGKRMGSVRRW